MLMDNKAIITEENYSYTDECYASWYQCPVCEETYITKDFKFCPICGVAVSFELKEAQK